MRESLLSLLRIPVTQKPHFLQQTSKRSDYTEIVYLWNKIWQSHHSIISSPAVLLSLLDTVRCCFISKKLLKGQSRPCLWWLQIKLDSSNQEEFDPFTLGKSSSSTWAKPLLPLITLRLKWRDQWQSTTLDIESHSLAYSPVVISESNCTSVSNRTMAKMHSFIGPKFW